MPISRLWLLAGLPLVLAACGGEGEVREERSVLETADTSQVEWNGEVPPAAPVDTGSAMGAGMGPVQLEPVGASGVSGQAMLSDVNGETQVMVTLNGATGTHQGHVHQGSCESPGPVVAPLEPVTAGGGASSSSTSTVQVPMATVMNGQHIVVYHEAGGSPGAPIVCGAIPQHST